MAGARIGYALAAAEVIASFQKLRLHFGVNRTAQIGALAALGDDAFLRGVVAEVERGRDEYRALAARTGCRRCRRRRTSSASGSAREAEAEAMVATLLELGVFVRKPWAPPIDGFIRVTVGTAAERARVRGASSPRRCDARAREAAGDGARMRYAIVSDVHCNLDALDAAFAALRDGRRAAVPGRHRGLRAATRTSASSASGRARPRPCSATTTSPRSTTSAWRTSTRPRARRCVDAGRAQRREPRPGSTASATSSACPSFCSCTARRSTTSSTSSTRRRAARAFAATDAPLIFIGHTHIAEVYALRPDGTIEHAPPAAGRRGRARRTACAT